MYTEETLKRFIAKNGISYVLEHLSSPELPKYIKTDLSKIGIFVDGTLNPERIYSLH